MEFDEALVEALRTRFPGDNRITIVRSDFLRFRLPDVPYKVLGNIPFNRTAAIVRRLVQADPPPRDAYLVVQREAAERFAGGPFSRETLSSLLLKPWWQIEIARRFRRTDFDPPPGVDAVALWLARRTRPLVGPTAGRGLPALHRELLWSRRPLNEAVPAIRIHANANPAAES